MSNPAVRMVIQRELRAGSRRAVTYWGRFLAAALATFVLWQGFSSLDQGRDLFFAAAWLAGSLCVLDGIRRAGAAIAEEKARGTLGLLLLTPLSGFELLFGKFFSVIIASLPLALAIVPIFGVCLLIGGVSGGEFLRVSLVVMNCLTISVAVGISISGSQRESTAAIIVTLFVLGTGALMLAPFTQVPVLAPLNPLSVFLLAPDSQYRAAPFSFWSALALSQAAVLGMLWLDGRTFAGARRREEQTQIAYQTCALPAPPSKENARKNYDVFDTPKWFSENPIEWLTLREMSLHSGTWVLSLGAGLCAVAAFTPIGLFYAFLFAFGLAVFLCIASCRTFATAREGGALEILVTTPLGVEGVIAGHIAALKRMFTLPSIIIVSTVGIYLVKSFFERAPREGMRMDGFEFYLLAGYALLLMATPWIGMWMGLRCKSPGRALLATITLVFLVPRLGFCYLIDPFYFLAMGILARRRVRRGFNVAIDTGGKPA